MSKKGKSKKRKVNNREDGKANVKNLNEPKNEEKGLKFDFSFNEETFRVYLIDYHHRLYYNQSKNTHGEKELTFYPMKSEIT